MHQNASFIRIINKAETGINFVFIRQINVHQEYKKLFSYLTPPEPPAGLFDKIMQRIYKEQRLLIIKRRIVLFSAGALGSAAAFIPVFRMVQSAFSQSGFLEFFSLLFSDSGLVITYWQNFALALMESLPVMSVAALLGTIFIFIGSIKFLSQDIKVVLTPVNNT
jgi:hypothetical protein